MRDQQDYARDWRNRRRAYIDAGNEASLITTDDLAGVRANELDKVVNNMISRSLGGRADTPWSQHHYTL